MLKDNLNILLKQKKFQLFLIISNNLAHSFVKLNVHINFVDIKYRNQTYLLALLSKCIYFTINTVFIVEKGLNDNNNDMIKV